MPGPRHSRRADAVKRGPALCTLQEQFRLWPYTQAKGLCSERITCSLFFQADKRLSAAGLPALNPSTNIKIKPMQMTTATKTGIIGTINKKAPIEPSSRTPRIIKSQRSNIPSGDASRMPTREVDVNGAESALYACPGYVAEPPD